MKIRNMLAFGILGIVILSLFAQIAILASQPVYFDVLKVQIGEDSVLDETGKIITDSFSQRNEENELSYKKVISNSQLSLPSTTMNAKIDLQQLLKENFLLETNYLETTKSELENGILNGYSFAILIVIGHGTKEGLIDESNVMLWDDVSTFVDEEDAHLTIVSSCFSNQATYNNDKAYGFSGEVDYQLAAYTTLALIYNTLGETSRYQQTFAQLFNRGMKLYTHPELVKKLGMVMDDPIGGGIPSDPPEDEPEEEPYMSWQEYVWAAIGVICIIIAATALIKLDPVKISVSLLRFIAVSGSLAIYSVINATVNYVKGRINLAEWCSFLAVFILKVISYVLAVITVAQYILVIAFYGCNIVSAGVSLALQIITVILTIALTAMVIRSIIIDWNDVDHTVYLGW